MELELDDVSERLGPGALRAAPYVSKCRKPRTFRYPDLMNETLCPSQKVRAFAGGGSDPCGLKCSRMNKISLND